MKRLLFVFLVMTCSVSWAEWEAASTDENGDFIVYVDKSTKRKSGNTVKMWIMTSFTSIQTSGMLKYQSTKSLDVYDCQEETIATISVFAYEGTMGSGKVITMETFQQREWKWVPFSPESINQRLWKIACGLR